MVRVNVRLHDLRRNGSLSFHEPELHSWDHPDCINAQPQGLLLWRSLTQWLGGMGVVMLGMLVLSRIIGGGMALAALNSPVLPCRDFAQSCARPPWRCGVSTCS